MDACLLSSLNPSALPFEPAVARELAECRSRPPAPLLPPPETFLPPGCLYPPPPPPPICGDAFASKLGCTSPQFVPVVGVPAFPHGGLPLRPVVAPGMACLCCPPPPAVVVCCSFPAPPPAPAAATRCRITEIEEDSGDGEAPKAETGSGSPTWRKAAVPLPTMRRAGAAFPLPHPPLQPTPPCDSLFSDTTSLMIRNIPNKFSKSRLMAILDQHCAQENEKLQPRTGCGQHVVKSEYDFLYVPIDFRTGNNKGYAFVNMTTACAARRLHSFLQNHRWEAVASDKVCDVVPAAVQGRQALVKRLSSSQFPCRTKAFLPVWFEPPRDGVRKTAAHVVGALAGRCR